MKAKKWDYKTKEYYDYELPEHACLDGYTSKQIHTELGFGYAVCEQCYEKEWREAIENEKQR